jgi:hypothetical protein
MAIALPVVQYPGLEDVQPDPLDTKRLPLVPADVNPVPPAVAGSVPVVSADVDVA